ncbi:endonuclease-8 [Nocardia farcinica]|uniref:Endonuclease 8 1 n=1 Tax=Nocardia farcinica TaxID=37329 RepID=A0A0H5NRY2_NOCFR|nr:DNA-formamidopyrimidine glycosylase family protein [Nocardia farcinica]AXK85967.1 Fpg/Nei family DNA glycosylase [Nocardia farcinica]MBF6068322.1 Fpg/Nei family DNA glycosylase [Nocardia farcinica]CRY78152.1 Formamidopyrimidine-DNA glycosylase [Nocardia farcinica]SIS89283.1 endonuclease-8 [Nocardia farcinica]
MPEGHTLHRLAERHRRVFAGGPVRVSSPQGRFAEGAALVDGRVLARCEAHGKHLLHHYEHGPVVHVHLGLYGKFYDAPVPMGPPVGEVRMRMVGATEGTDLRGPAACEVLTPPEVDALLARLGPDPLRADADPDRAWQRIRRSRRPIGALLMDQRVLAGVGNVYRAEVLFRHGISPYRPGVDLDAGEWKAIWADLVDLMPIGVETGRMHVVRPEHDHGEPSYAPDRPRTYVYRRPGAGCRVCGSPIAHAVLDGRNLFWCPTCQPR